MEKQMDLEEGLQVSSVEAAEMEKQMDLEEGLQASMSGFDRLPGDVLICILKHLPSKDAKRFWLIKKTWGIVFNNIYEDHMREMHPILAGEHDHRLVLVMDLWAKFVKQRFRPISYGFQTQFQFQTQCVGYGCRVGLLGDGSFSIYDSNGVNMVVKLPQSIRLRTDAYALFVENPRYSILSILFAVFTSDMHEVQEYIILKIGLDSSETVIVKPSPNFNGVKNGSKAAVLIGEHVYWLLNSDDVIIQLNLITAQIRALPLASFILDFDAQNYQGIDILHVGGALSLFLVLVDENVIYQWQLQDAWKQTWKRLTHTNLTTDWKEHMISDARNGVSVLAFKKEEKKICMMMNIGDLIIVDLKTGETKWAVCYGERKLLWPIGSNPVSLRVLKDKTISIDDAQLELEKAHLDIEEVQPWEEFIPKRGRRNMTVSEHANHLELIAKRLGIEAAETYFNNLPESSYLTYAALMSCYCKELLTDKAVSLLARMKEVKVDLTSMLYNSVMKLYFQSGKPEKIPEVIEEMKGRNIKLDVCSYDVWMRAVAASGDIPAVERVVEEIKTEEMSDWTLYGSLASIYLDASCIGRAVDALKEVEKRKTPSDLIAYHFLITMYGRIRNSKEVERLWESSKEVWRLDFPKNANSSYLNVIKAFIKVNDITRAGTLFEEWECLFKEEGKFLFDIRIANAVMKSYITNGHLGKALDVQKRVRMKGGQANSETFYIFLNHYLRSGEINQALKCLKDALSAGERDGTNWFPTSVIFSRFEELFDPVIFSRFKELFEKNLDAESLEGFIKDASNVLESEDASNVLESEDAWTLGMESEDASAWK